MGSYAELKHDTILFAKQYSAAEGDFPPAALEPRHWVEPDPVAFTRLSAVLGLLGDGLDSRGLLSEENSALIDELRSMFDRFARIAADELAGRPISDADNQWLEAMSFILEALWVQASDFDPAQIDPAVGPEGEIAVIADIGRNTFAIHEIGVGLVNPIYVIVPNDEGEFQVAVGGVYSFYEFWQPADQGRLTDEEWRAILRDNPPDRPAWTDTLFDVEKGPTVGGCWQQTDADYARVVADFVEFERPAQWDEEQTGRPCEQFFQPEAVNAFFGSVSDLDTGLFCRDLEPLGYTFAEAVGYWLLDRAPERMDADRNGIPCETVYPKNEIDAFFGW